MALIYDSRWRALDANGNPLSGATLTLYNAGTTTLANVFRDAALSSAMTNPTSGSDTSNADGWFPQVFASEGANFDIILKTSGGSTLASYLSVAAIGAQSGSLTRDFTNSRYSVSGTSGIVSVEAGDPTGDNVGGKMRVGGWAGTQADDIELDGVLVNVTGRLKERSKKIPGTVYTEGVVSGVANMDITLPVDPAGVKAWQIEIIDLIVTSAATLSARFSTDGGATFYSGASDYYYSVGTIASGSFTSTRAEVGASPSAASSMSIAPTTLNANSVSRLNLFVVANNIDGTHWGLNTSVNLVQNLITGVLVANQSTQPTTLRIIASAGTMSAKYRVIPRRGLGDT